MSEARERDHEVLLEIGKDVPEEQRSAIEASVRTMAARSVAAARQAADTSAAYHRLQMALARPLRRLVDADKDAAAEVAAAEQELAGLHHLPVTDEPEWPTVRVVEGRPATDFLADRVFSAPWHYQWSWHDLSGDPPTTSTQDRQTGQIVIGVHADQNHNRINAHGGFGVALTTDRVQALAGRSLRRTDHSWIVHAGSFGGSATVEGGTEMTALEGGRLLSSAQDRRFRLRLSNGERNDLGFHGWSTGEGIEVNWVMLPGRTYTLNVGGWVFGEAHGGVGTASIANARLHSLVIALTIDVTD